MAWFAGMVLVVNPSAITITATQNMTHTVNPFTIGSDFNLRSTLPLFGPNFNSKCILGFYRQRHKGSDWMSTYFTYSTFGNFDNLHMDSAGTPPTSDWRILCFGNSTECR
jgi:hypothetical protein